MAQHSRLVGASLLLLGTEHPPEDLDSAALTRAYHRMALLTHPDTQGGVRLPRVDFVHVREAFDELERFLRRREIRSPRAGAAQGTSDATPPRGGASPSGPREAHRGAGGRAPWYWNGKLPSRRLRLGEYLFYAGRIPWDALIRAIVQQRQGRPHLGEMALQRDLVTHAQLLRALTERGPGERLGETLVRLGLLQKAQLDELVKEQASQQQPLGACLARLGALDADELPALIAALARHNRAARRPSSRPTHLSSCGGGRRGV